MEQGFIEENSSNLPRIDLLMLGEFLASNKDFYSSEFRNVKTSLSSRPSYGDDAISYVQLKLEGEIGTVKCKICPEHKVQAKLYGVTLTVDEDEEKAFENRTLSSDPVTYASKFSVNSINSARHAVNVKMCVHGCENLKNGESLVMV
ncbi:hypothetical protein FQA39_LY00586 [Lamprigera yunnana]|nr:hypothetical protein FQA39_LY00586 [Lamprigera yunnana]